MAKTNIWIPNDLTRIFIVAVNYNYYATSLLSPITKRRTLYSVFIKIKKNVTYLVKNYAIKKRVTLQLHIKFTLNIPKFCLKI